MNRTAGLRPGANLGLLINATVHGESRRSENAPRGQEPTPGPSQEGSTAGRARKIVPLLGGARGGLFMGEGQGEGLPENSFLKIV
jgi:hypothetical protein